MRETRGRYALWSFSILFSFTLVTAAQRTTRPDPTDPAHPFDTPAAVAVPATDEQFARWREQAKAALFIPTIAPPVGAHDFGSFTPMRGVVAHRVTYGTQFGMRVTAVVYRPDHFSGKLPAVIVVAGHGGSKSSWYEVYAGLLYASAGAVVVTFDPIGEEERNSQHLTDARAHDTVLPGLQSPARMGGLMIGDVMGAVSYVLSLPEVDSKRIAVVGYSMGSFHAALAAGLDPRISALVLSGGGDLDGNGGSWDSSSKIMCQGGPYQSLSFLPDKDDAAQVAALGAGKVVCEEAGERPHEAKLLQLDCEKARRKLGWRPRLTFADSVKFTADWYAAWKQGHDMSAFTRSQIAAFETIGRQA